MWLAGFALALGSGCAAAAAEQLPIEGSISPAKYDRRPGMCAMYGNCGKKSAFGGELPCPANVPAQPLKHSDKIELLADVCGLELAHGAVCCDEHQVDELVADLKRAEPIIASCPACLRNFFDVFCQFTCSPNQSLFVEPLRTKPSNDGREAIAELNYWVDSQLGERVYDSCAGVKFSASNGRAMDLVGGGATNYEDFFKFLGDEKAIGSPFQINFPWNQDHLPKNIVPQNSSVGYSCATDGSLGCSCVDCDAACPQLPPLEPPERCQVGPFYCLSAGLLSGYAFCIGIAALVRFRMRRSKSAGSRSALEIQRLIHDEEIDADDDPFLVPSTSSTGLLVPYQVNSMLQIYFTRLAGFCARFPYVVITLCTLLVLVSSLGLFNAVVETDPIKLWVGPDSIEAEQKQLFDDQFGPFYRTAQIYAVNDTGGPILSQYETLEWWASVEDRVAKLETNILHDSLSNFCFKPLGEACVVESVSQYFGGHAPPAKDWHAQIEKCVKSPVQCLPAFQQPIDPRLVFGTYNTSVFDSEALVASWVLNNHQDVVYGARVEQWELELETFLRHNVTSEARDRGIRVSFSVESSLERELGRGSTTDVTVVIVSYIFMFAYVALALGRGASKFWLGLFGILVVLLSVVSSLGICSLLGISLSFVVTEVIPFLTLAIGVDNIFLIVHQIELVSELSPQLGVDEHVARAVGTVGPSIFLSTTCETAAFLVGAFVAMPAVHNFALIAAMAVLVNSTLQLTMFVAATAIHLKRRARKQLQEEEEEEENLNTIRNSRSRADHNSNEPTMGYQQGDPRRFSFLFSAEYTPLLLRRTTKQVVMGIFMAWLAFSFSIVGRTELGLDQRLAVPRDSFLVDYFSDVASYLGVGPPVYFVVERPGAEWRDNQRALCSRFSTCLTDSVPNVLEQERKRPAVSYLASSPASWLDDFFQWLNPELSKCCVEYGRPCYANKEWDYSMNGFPEGENFTHYLGLWLAADNSMQCPLAGKAPYGSSIYEHQGDKVDAVHYRTAHTPLRTQQDYIQAYNAARDIARDMERTTDLNIFPYSVFYPFFAQYRTIATDTVVLVTLALGLVLAVAIILLGSPKTALVVTSVVAIMIVNIAGLMVLLGITLNALSLVNLVICVGLGVEFCIHIARSFSFVPHVSPLGVRGNTRTDRAYNAVAGTGGTVFGGIAVTKLIGVSVLAFAHSRIFVVFYFRMWLALVFCATLHSLALLPVMLSFWGGKAWLLEEANEAETFADLEEL